jgi:hypothetical protein
MKIIHITTVLALCAPVLAFYVVIAGEVMGYQPTQQAILLTQNTLFQACSAWAKEIKR